MFWIRPNRLAVFSTLIINQLHSEFKILVGPTASQGHTLIFISLFLFIIYNNLLGLLPYVFTSSSHLAITLTLAFPL